MSWNVENLFDCHDDPLKDDGEFLPESERRWTPARYWRKQDQLARTIAAVEPQNGWPLLVGMMEVENDSVLFDLTRRSPLRRAGYDFLVTQSPDVRGIDVALLYQPKAFRLLAHCSVRVPSAQNGFRPTRDILHATGLLPSGDTLHVVAVHLPSRSGNSRQSARHRRLAMSSLCTVLDSLQGKKTVLMGDFNAEPSDPLFQMLEDRM
ncbi:MAG: endonuclease, partial [Bacteroidaceae bacterium]|nr:endonuclease [Bacteroidaceae bacterium]